MIFSTDQLLLRQKFLLSSETSTRYPESGSKSQLGGDKTIIDRTDENFRLCNGLRAWVVSYSAMIHRENTTRVHATYEG